MPPTWDVSLIAVMFVALVHALSGSLHRGAVERPRWISAASGLSLAYVFIHVLPELAEVQARWLDERRHRPLIWFESQIYVMALVGVLLSLALGQQMSGARGRPRFALRIGGFALYNMLIGCLALRLESVVSLVLAAVAFGAHVLVNDHALDVEYGGPYRRVGRWVLSAALLIGWLIGVFWWPPLMVGASLLSLLSGAIIFNVLRDELTPRRTSHVPAFIAGTIGYTVLLLALDYSQHEAHARHEATSAMEERARAGTATSCRPVLPGAGKELVHEGCLEAAPQHSALGDSRQTLGFGRRSKLRASARERRAAE